MSEKSQVFNNGDDKQGSTFVQSAGFIGKVFLYMFFGLLISAVSCLGASYALFYGLSNGSTEIMESQMMTYLIILMVSGVLLLILSLFISFRRMSMKNITVPYILYALLMGIMLSGLVVFVGDPNLLAMTLGITSLMFLIMCLFGYLYKGKGTWVVGMMVGGLVSIGVLFVVNLFLFPFAFHVESAFDAYCTIYWIIEAIYIVIILISTAIDMWNIRKISQSGAGSNNVAMYCALNLYSDFIILFIRILYFVILAGGNRKD